ncbi:hypothetical protein K504DRAFT_501001 [Pleomassaria siparia CBS 279.74]|uniref:Uncharacterized protein n=1 Tax=Pleomassaria siparia CBS 279.74 TaxID=1314801 RepID=A0A6G1KFD3_9PLEO|nr:hypothetical protein K504DRAFT_501001 [Pleomassaria siparia CBS 279.74]
MALPVNHDPPASSTFEQPALPKLSSTPTVHPGCCLALSAPLLTFISSVLPPPPHLALSIGSGYGLFEALLLASPYTLNIIGVEVHPSPNQYLPPSNHESVSGSRFLHPLAAKAKAWLFIYPRRVGMITEYFDAYGDTHVETVVWVGPKADWEDYKGCFGQRWTVDVESVDEVGGRAWELIALARKKAAR